MIHTDGAPDADHTSTSIIYRDPSGRMVSTRADSSGTIKTTNFNMLIVQVEHSSIKGANAKFEYTGIDPQTFSPDRSATYTRTSVAASGAVGVLKVEYYVRRQEDGRTGDMSVRRHLHRPEHQP